MKKRIHDLFAISRNERIGLICFFIVMATIIGIVAFKPQQEKPTANTEQLALELQETLNSSTVDTIKTKKRQAKSKKVKHRTLTVKDLEDTKTFE